MKILLAADGSKYTKKAPGVPGHARKPGCGRTTS